jgi:hypothetical protein
MMQRTFGVRPITLTALLALLLSGCATKPPAPPECEGPLVPINVNATAPTTGDPNAERPRS